MKKKIVSCCFLPIDIVERAMPYLGLPSLAAASRVCKDWQEVDLRESLGLPRSFAFKDSKETILGWMKRHPIRYMSMLNAPTLSQAAQKLIAYHGIPEKTLSSHLQALTITKEYAPLPKIISSRGAFVAVLVNGQCRTWGHSKCVGTTPVIPTHGSIRSVHSNGTAFVSILDNGQCLVWESPAFGGTPPVIPEGRSIRSVHSTASAFVAVLDNGQCVALGNPRAGGTTPVIPADRSIRSVHSNYGAFVAVLDDGQCVAWGDRLGGGPTPVIPADRSIRSVHSTAHAFVAVLDNGQCLAWGDPNFGGKLLSTLDHIAVWE